MGAVLHTLNIRLFPEQLAYVINHAEDKVIIVDASLIPAAGPGPRRAARRCEHVIVVGEGDTTALGETLVLRGPPGRRGAGLRLARARRARRRRHVLHERHHRQPQGRRLQPPLDLPARHGRQRRPAASGMTERDRLLVIVPMFHANAWGTPYAGCMAGADLVMPQHVPPGRAPGPDHRRAAAHPVLRRAHHLERPAAGGRADPTSTCPRCGSVTAGGSAVPRALIEAFEDRFGITMSRAGG